MQNFLTDNFLTDIASSSGTNFKIRFWFRRRNVIKRTFSFNSRKHIFSLISFMFATRKKNKNKKRRAWKKVSVQWDDDGGVCWMCVRAAYVSERRLKKRRKRRFFFFAVYTSMSHFCVPSWWSKVSQFSFIYKGEYMYTTLSHVMCGLERYLENIFSFDFLVHVRSLYFKVLRQFASSLLLLKFRPQSSAAAGRVSFLFHSNG